MKHEFPKMESARPRAVALRYTGDGAPRVTAKGDGELADALLAVADRHGVPRHRDPALAAVLSGVELDAEIPVALYVAVAAVLALVYAAADVDLGRNI